MDKLAIEKNRLDLSYKRNLQLMNIVLLIGGGALVAYFAGVVLNSKQIYEYSLLFAIVSALMYIGYKKIDEKLKTISKKIKELI